MIERTRHAHDVETFGQLILRQDFLLLTELTDRLTGLKGFLRQFRGHFITDVRIQAGDDGEALLDGGGALFRIGAQTFEALIGENLGAAG